MKNILLSSIPILSLGVTVGASERKPNDMVIKAHFSQNIK